MLEQIISVALWMVMGIISAVGWLHHLLNCFPTHHDLPLFLFEVIVFPVGVVVGWGMILGLVG